MIDLTPVIQALFTLLVALVTVFLIPFLRQKVDEGKLSEIYTWISIAVEAAEQIYKESGMGQKKKEFVLNFLAEQGFTVDLDVLDAMIESAVLSLKK